MGKVHGPLREFLFIVAAFALVLGGLFAYTGTWPPAVIVESGSMMHADAEVRYGRLGTIDPGDLVLVKAIDGPHDVETWAETGERRYGDRGDVVVYERNGNAAGTPIIHRAIAWITVTGDGEAREYAVHWNPDVPCPGGSRTRDAGTRCVFGPEGITIPEIGLTRCTASCATSGLITKGDNPATNPEPDQVAGISRVVQPEWIRGKARAELPWLGLLKLALGPAPNQDSPPDAWLRIGMAYAPTDLWVMLGVSVLGLVGGPVAYDAWRSLRARPDELEPADPKTP